MSAGFGTEVWGSAAWRSLAGEWVDARLADAGRRRTGPVEQPHLRPWATVLRVPVDGGGTGGPGGTGGTVWMKAAGPGTAFEAGLCDLLARVVPDRVLVPLATDPGRGWMLLPDGGPPLGERLDGAALADEMVAALVAYGRLQLDLAPHVDEMLALGVADMRPAAMPGRYAEAVAATGTPADLAPTLEVACRLAKVARTLTWDRAVRAAREDGQPVDDDWATAPRETLLTLLGPSYLPA
jgi:hypothetical protein